MTPEKLEKICIWIINNKRNLPYTESELYNILLDLIDE